MFPIYWVPQRVGSNKLYRAVEVLFVAGFQFIGFPSEWGVAKELQPVLTVLEILFPIYWVPQRVGSSRHFPTDELPVRFPIYWVPQRVGSGLSASLWRRSNNLVFPIYWVPQRVGRRSWREMKVLFNLLLRFPIYWVPQRVGSL